MLEQIAPSATTNTLPGTGRQWWREAEGDAWRLMLARAKRIANDQEEARADMRLFGQLYSGRRLSSLHEFGAASSRSTQWDFVGHRVAWNIVQAAVDTAAARIAKNRTRVRVLTFAGDWSKQQSAKNLTRWLDGLFHEQRYYDDVSQPAFSDGAIFGFGCPQVTATADGIEVERALPFELLIDEAEGMHRRPRNAYRAAVLPRDTVEDVFGTSDELREIIRAAPASSASTTLGDVIDVVEGWHVGEKGRRIVAVASGKLLDEPWKLKRLPISRFAYGDLPVGWSGLGIVARLVGIQLQLNDLNRKIQDGQRLMAGGHWAVPQGSSIVPGHLVNKQGSLIYYTGDRAPTPMLVPALPPEVYEERERLWRSGFELVGLSAQAVTGTIPAGLTSGAAQREAQEVQNDRFSLVAQRYDAMTVDVAELAVSTAKQAFHGNKSLKVRAPSTSLIERIDWKDIDLTEDAYLMRAYPANILPSTPGARLEKVKELLADGLIPREAALALLDMPDIESAVSPGATQHQEATRAVSRLLETEEYEAPDEQLRPDVALAVGGAMYLSAKGEGAPPKALGLVLRWLDDARAVLRSQAEAALPPPGAAPPPGMPPDMAGGAPPMPGLPPDLGMPDPNAVGVPPGGFA